MAFFRHELLSDTSRQSLFAPIARFISWGSLIASPPIAIGAVTVSTPIYWMKLFRTYSHLRCQINLLIAALPMLCVTPDGASMIELLYIEIEESTVFIKMIMPAGLSHCVPHCRVLL